METARRRAITEDNRMKAMHAVILCAGYATRMGALTRTTPKPLLPVAGKPIIDYLVDEMLRFARFDSIRIVTNDRFYPAFVQWRQARLERSEERMPTLEIINDGTTSNDGRLGALGDLEFALEGLPADGRVVAAAGDNIFLFPLVDLWQRFAASADHWILALRECDPRDLRRSAVLELDAEERVLAVHQKPADPISEWTNPMIYCLQPTARDRLREMLSDRRYRHGCNFIDVLCRQERVRAFKCEGERLHVGDELALRAAHERLSVLAEIVVPSVDDVS